MTLGVAGDADEREVRRSYARRLKLLDQATQPVEFQRLREAYEQALKWARDHPVPVEEEVENEVETDEVADEQVVVRGVEADRVIDRDEIEMPVPTPPPAAPASVLAVPLPDAPPLRLPVVERLSPPRSPRPSPMFAPADIDRVEVDEDESDDDVIDEDEIPGRVDDYAAAHAVVGALVAQLSPDAVLDERRVRALLQAAANDARLASVDARHLFEGILVAGLAAGWRAHHEHLFVAAIEQFDWRTDRARLRRYGNEGLMVDAAIDQYESFLNQQKSRRRHQLRVIRRLRSARAPSTWYLLRTMPLLEVLDAAWPHWLGIVSSASHLGAWRVQHAAIPRWKRFIKPSLHDRYRMPKSQSGRRWFGGWGRWVFFGSIVVNVVWHLLQGLGN